MERLFYIVGGVLVLGAAAVNAATRLWLKPEDEEADEVYWEFEDQDVAYARYTRWLRASLSCLCLGLLLLFVAIAV